jgi:hypothetical protein
MSRWFVSRVAAVLVLAVLVVAFAACPTRAAGIDLKVDGQSIDALFPPILHRGVVMVPLDDLCAQVNTPCARDGERLFTRSAKGEVVEIVKSANRAWIGQTEHRLSVAPVFLTDTVLVPANFASEVLGLAVKWDPVGRVISFDRQDTPKDSAARKAARAWQATLQDEAAWSIGTFASTITSPDVRLQLPIRSGVTVRGFVRLKGDTDQSALKVRVAKGSFQEWSDLDLIQNTFNQRIWLTDGAGRYTVEILKPAVNKPGYYNTVCSFEIENALTEKTGSGLVLFAALPGQAATGSVDLEGWAASRKFMVNVRSPDEKSIVVFDVETDQSGYFARTAYLPFGPGAHTVSIWDMTGSESGPRLLNMTIQNAGAAAFGRAQTRLTKPLPSNTTVTDSLRLEGTSHKSVLQAWVKKDGQVSYHNVQVLGGRFTASIPLTAGAGKYTVEMRYPATDPGWWMLDDSFQITFQPAVQNVEYLSASDTTQADDPDIRELAAGLTAGLASNTDKATAIYQWITRNIAYDVPKSKQNRRWWQGSASLCLGTRTGVCEDFALLFAAMCRAANVPARVKIGYASQATTTRRTYHAWNEFHTGTGWAPCDPTWDAGYVDGDRWVQRAAMGHFNVPSKFAGRTETREEGWIRLAP